jgi:hypothetical protein
MTAQDFFASLNATLANKDNKLIPAQHTIPVNDYTVPAPPPPSPVSSFRPDHWPTSMRKH